MELISTKQKGLLALYPEYMSFSSNVNTVLMYILRVFIKNSSSRSKV